MILPSPAPRYDVQDQASVRQALEREITQLRGALNDALMANGAGLLLRSPNGSHWLVTVDNSGTLHIAAYTPVPGR